MTKTVREFEGEVFDAVRVRPYIELPPILWERGIATIKLRFRAKSVRGGFVQFYYNQVNGKTFLVLLTKGTRSYGHDYTPDKGWHRHRWPQGNHNYSEEGKKPVTVQEFMEGVDKILAAFTKRNPTFRESRK